MSIGLTPALQSSQRCLQAFAAKAPEALLPIIRSPIFYKSVALLFGVRIFSIVTRWIRQRPWKAEGELAIVTGGSSGIGRQIVQDLVKLRVKVVILDTKEPQSDLSSGVFFYKVDITSSKRVNDVAQRIATEHGYPTILINNAGVAVEGTILDKDEKDIRLTMEVNTLSHFWTVKAFLPSMVEKNHGHIITIASLASFVSMGEAVDYGCSKAAALAFHEGLTQEVKHWYKANNVRTSVIHPLWVRTPMIDKILRAGKHFRQRVLEPEEVSRAVINQIVSQTGGQITVPSSYRFMPLIRALPNRLQESLRDIVSSQTLEFRRMEKELQGSG